MPRGRRRKLLLAVLGKLRTPQLLWLPAQAEHCWFVEALAGWWRNPRAGAPVCRWSGPLLPHPLAAPARRCAPPGRQQCDAPLRNTLRAAMLPPIVPACHASCCADALPRRENLSCVPSQRGPLLVRLHAAVLPRAGLLLEAVLVAGAHRTHLWRTLLLLLLLLRSRLGSSLRLCAAAPAAPRRRPREQMQLQPAPPVPLPLSLPLPLPLPAPAPAVLHAGAASMPAMCAVARQLLWREPSGTTASSSASGCSSRLPVMLLVVMLQSCWCWQGAGRWAPVGGGLGAGRWWQGAGGLGAGV